MSEMSDGPRLGRYTDLGLIGHGAMAEVRRVWDPNLQRSVAMKIGFFEVVANDEDLARFRDEARATAQLQHPSVVSVHDMGELADGRPFFTMKEIVGRTLAELVDEAHHAPPDAPPSTWTVRRLLDACLQACQAVAYAHVRGVIHRDLKPKNIMVGEYGEVLVVDWGLAKVVGEAEPERRLKQQDREADLYQTQDGTVMGTPMYMAPEQAEGRLGDVGPRSDVFSLGAVLFHVLTGSGPYKARNLGDLLIRVMSGQVEPLVGPSPIPEDLADICRSAMAREPAQRPANAGELAARLSRWLEGETRRERAAGLIASAEAARPRISALRAAAESARAEAARIALPPGAPLDQRQQSWRIEDEAERLDREAELEQVRQVQALRGALELADLPAAREQLAAWYRSEAEAAALRRDHRAEAAALAQLAAYDQGQHAGWIAGLGTITLRTEPPAEATLYRYELRDRRLTPTLERALGRTPIVALALPAGSYLITLRAEGLPELRYPVHLRREQRWTGAPPGEEPRPIRLPSRLAPDEIAVLAGPCWIGGDPSAPRALARAEVWVPSFVMAREPVTNAAYMAYINDLAMRGLAEEAMRGSPAGGASQPYLWAPTLPVHAISAASAEAYAAWLAERTGLPWRLPTEIEREKASRGVDGRYFPWGDFFDPDFCNMVDTPRRAPGPELAGARPLDESPYGALGLAGDLREWCADAVEGGARVTRGGSWMDAADQCRCAARALARGSEREPRTGFRLVRSL